MNDSRSEHVLRPLQRIQEPGESEEEVDLAVQMLQLTAEMYTSPRADQFYSISIEQPESVAEENRVVTQGCEECLSDKEHRRDEEQGAKEDVWPRKN